MRLVSLLTHNFLSLEQHRLEFRRPVLLIGGPNEVGKTTIANAISFALTGLPRRANIVKKKDLAKLLSYGKTTGSVTLEAETESDEKLSFYRDITTGRCTSPAIDDPVVTALLDMHHFGSLTNEQRLALLFNKRPEFDAIKKIATLEYDVTESIIEAYRSWIETSFETARQKIRERGTELKGEWKALTKENWGEEKGAEWTARKAEALSGFGVYQCPHCHKPLAVGESGVVIAMHEAEDEVTQEAYDIHKNITEHIKLYRALGPLEIPLHFVKTSIDIINKLLKDSSVQTGWRPIRITDAGDITVGDEPYYLLSESAQWRTDAQLTIALARWSEWRFAVLDRFDVLDIKSRPAIIAWLNSAAPHMSSIVIIATLKAPPQTLENNTLQLEWME